MLTVGDYLLHTTKDRMLLITSKRRMLQFWGGKWLNWLHSILGWFSTDFRKLKILSKHLLPQSRVREFQEKQVSEEPRYRAGLIPHRSSCPWAWLLLPDLGPTGFSEWDLGCISPTWNSSLYSILAGSPWFYPFALCLCVGGRYAWKSGLQKNVWSSGQ